MNLIFSADSIDECLKKASEELNVNTNDLKYKVIKEERKFFKKKITIEIQNDFSNLNSGNIQDKKDNSPNLYGAQVKNGRIIVKPSNNENDIITIKSCEGIDLFLNGVKTDIIEGVKESDVVECAIVESQQAERRLGISVSKDKMEAYITIKSIPQLIYDIEDSELIKNLILKRVLIKEKYAPKYTAKDIKEALKDQKIVFGIEEKNIEEACDKDEVINLLVAKGVQAIEGTPEKMEILFKDSDKLKESADTEIKIDYRNRFMLATVKAGEEIARVIPSKPGKDGKDIYGNDIKRKDASRVKFKTGEGCKYENNKVIATVEGKPSFRSNTFKVHQVYEVEEVNLSTGNINFVADVEVAKTVDEGMEVIAGNTVLVGKNVESAKVIAASDITVRGNILNSTVSAGEKAINKKKYLLNLNDTISIVDDLYSDAVQLANNNVLGSRKVGELVKILIENKYKTFIPLCETIIKECEIQGITDSPITSFINNKIVGFGPITIQHEEELLEFIGLLKEECDELESFEADEANIYTEYIQGSKVEAIGSVFINGKGQYTSEITALNNIEFIQENSVCRGGVLSAGKEIKLKTVGSEAGVNTVLKVPKDGVITADIAYNNTTFCFGEKQLVLDVSSRNVKAYVDEMGDITIDKLLL